MERETQRQSMSINLRVAMIIKIKAVGPSNYSVSKEDDDGEVEIYGWIFRHSTKGTWRFSPSDSWLRKEWEKGEARRDWSHGKTKSELISKVSSAFEEID